MITLSNTDFSVCIFAAFFLGVLVNMIVDACIEIHMAKWRIKRARQITQESNEAVARMQEIHVANVEMQEILKEGE